MNRKGFTLIELVMVIVIIGVLAAIAIPRFVDLRKDARQASCKATGGAIRAALSNFYASTALHSETPHFPANVDASLASYMQGGTPQAPTSGTWGAVYTTTNGELVVPTTAGEARGTACPRI
ncbi:MAG: type II secretion system protein [Candidatus Omnitrophica bacterium]|nr:type II secretion system protein [Candidatus Omnitrophota bacterium]